MNFKKACAAAAIALAAAIGAQFAAADDLMPAAGQGIENASVQAGIEGQVKLQSAQVVSNADDDAARYRGHERRPENRPAERRPVTRNYYNVHNNVRIVVHPARRPYYGSRPYFADARWGWGPDGYVWWGWGDRWYFGMGGYYSCASYYNARAAACSADVRAAYDQCVREAPYARDAVGGLATDMYGRTFKDPDYMDQCRQNAQYGNDGCLASYNTFVAGACAMPAVEVLPGLVVIP